LSQKIKEMKELSEKLKSDYEKATNDSKAELEKQFSETKNKLEKLYEEAKKQLDLREIALQTREQEFESKIKAFEER
jgi:hypothetical protein